MWLLTSPGILPGRSTGLMIGRRGSSGPMIEPMSPNSLPTRLSFDGDNTVRDVIDALALAPFISGEQPWAFEARIERCRIDAPLRPASSRIVRKAADRDGPVEILAEGEGWTL